MIMVLFLKTKWKQVFGGGTARVFSHPIWSPSRTRRNSNVVPVIYYSVEIPQNSRKIQKVLPVADVGRRTTTASACSERMCRARNLSEGLFQKARGAFGP